MIEEARLKILTDGAKYDVSCSSSGSRRKNTKDGTGNAAVGGLCHSFTQDGRCISLLKMLMSNDCVFDCKYCPNRHSADVPRASVSPREMCELVMGFYRRNYIEGLFLSSAVLRDPDYTTERMIETLRLIREEYGFAGYIHAKAIPGADPLLTYRLGLLADRLSCNIELPSEAGLRTLAPEKTKTAILAPMRQIQVRAAQNREELVKYRHTPRFAPAGQSTQMIVGATPDSDLHILRLTQGLYDRYRLKRVFFSAYVPVVESALLPSRETKPPILREHRLYQADWLLRFYGFRAEELLEEQTPSFDDRLDPKCCWALRHPEFFPVEVNHADYEALLRIPGVGVVSARRILAARRVGPLRIEQLPKLGVVMKRAQYFLTASGRLPDGLRFTQDSLLRSLISLEQSRLPEAAPEQLSLFDNAVS